MTIRKERNVSIVMIIALILSLVLPQVAAAYTTVGGPEGSLTIHKFERPGDIGETNEGNGNADETVPEDAVALPGVTFEVIQTHTFNPETNKWTEVTDGASYELTTGENGSISKTNMPLGRYTVQEIAGPDHVVLNSQEFSVDIPMTSADGEVLNYDVHIYPKNETILGAVELTKTGEDGQELLGAEFELYKGISPDGEKVDGTYTTGENGKFAVNDLAYGDYYFVETKAPDGHVLNNTPIAFKVEATGSVDEDGSRAGTVVEVEKDNYIIPEIEKDANGQKDLSINRDEKFTYNLKVTLPADIQDYKEFVVTDDLDERLNFVADNTEVEGLTFTQDGQKLTWSIADFSKFDGVEDFTIIFTAKINPDAELVGEETGIPNEVTIDFDNDRGGKEDEDNPPTSSVEVTPTDGELNIIKVDAADNTILLPGAVFDVKNKDGTDVIIPEDSLIKVNDNLVTSLNDLVTGENGELDITGLPLGEYILVETKAPTFTDDDGVEKPYRLLTKPIDIEVTEELNEYTVENSKSGWNLPTTGGIGTILFTVIGLTFMGLALFLLTRRKKEETEA